MIALRLTTCHTSLAARLFRASTSRFLFLHLKRAQNAPQPLPARYDVEKCVRCYSFHVILRLRTRVASRAFFKLRHEHITLVRRETDDCPFITLSTVLLLTVSAATTGLLFALFASSGDCEASQKKFRRERSGSRRERSL